MKNMILKVKCFIHRLRHRNHPKIGYMYGITNGIYKGTTIIFFDLDTRKSPEDYTTLAIAEDIGAKGGMRIFKIPETALKQGIDTGVIEKIKKLPKWMYDIFVLEYKARLNIAAEMVKDEIKTI